MLVVLCLRHTSKEIRLLCGLNNRKHERQSQISGTSEKGANEAEQVFYSYCFLTVFSSDAPVFSISLNHLLTNTYSQKSCGTNTTFCVYSCNDRDRRSHMHFTMGTVHGSAFPTVLIYIPGSYLSVPESSPNFNIKVKIICH